MSKQGTKYLRLLGLLLGILLGFSGLCRLLPQERCTLYTPLKQEVGDETLVSGFVLRQERLILTTSDEYREGAWLCAGAIEGSEAGYFSEDADGYESLLTPCILETVTLSDLEGLLPKAVPPGASRLISGQSWYFLCGVEDSRQKDCPVGGRLSLCLQGKEYPMEICRLAPGEEGRFLLILRCDHFLQEMTSLRKEEAALIFSTQEGLLLPKEALYYLDDTTGVYVLQGGRCRFKKVEILAFLEENVLVKEDRSSIRCLRAEDQVILTEQEIYDGKVLHDTGSR